MRFNLTLISLSKILETDAYNVVSARQRHRVRFEHLLTNSNGRLIDRLCRPPEELLAQAYRLRRRAEWVQPQSRGPFDLGRFLRGDDDDEQPTGTRERDDDDDNGESETAGLSHHIRIVGTPEIALEHFITIQNSGCFSEG